MRAAPRADIRRLPFLPLDLRPGFSRHAATPPIAAAPFLPIRRDFDEVRKFGDDGLEAVGTDEDQYTLRWHGPLDACFRVLWSNPPYADKHEPGKAEKIREQRRKYSLLGEEGHIEKMNARTHLFGALIFAIFAIARPLTLETHSLTGILCTTSAVIVVLVFAVSTTYHTLGTVRKLSPFLRLFDHAAIYVSLGIATSTDASIATLEFEDVPWQTICDAALVAAVLLGFFVYRRFVLDPSHTEIGWGSCKLGLFRFQHSDFEFGPARSAGYLVNLHASPDSLGRPPQPRDQRVLGRLRRQWHLRLSPHRRAVARQLARLARRRVRAACE